MPVTPKQPETANILFMKRASGKDKAYYARLRRNNRRLPCPAPPASLADVFQKLEAMNRQLGELAEPGRADTDHGDLQSHLEYLNRIHRLDSAKHA